MSSRHVARIAGLMMVLGSFTWRGPGALDAEAPPVPENVPRQPPRPEVTLTLFLEPFSPFTTVRHEAPASLRLPRHDEIRLSVSSSAAVADFVWTGARRVSGDRRSSAAIVESQRPGTYEVVVTPVVRLRDGSLETRHSAAKSILLTLTNQNAANVDIRLTDKTTAPLVAHKGEVFQLQAETRPVGYEDLIEWTGGGSPSTGMGPGFSTSYLEKGRYAIRAGRSSSRAVEVYALASVRWASTSGQVIWYGYPITFTAATDPAGYERNVPWRVEAMHDMMTHAEPNTGRGPTFTTTFSPTMGLTTFWAQVYAAETPVFANPDQQPPCSPPSCDDGNPCTDDGCVAGTCVHADNHNPCDDGNVCTGPDICANGACSAFPYPGVGCPGLPATGYDEEPPAAVADPCPADGLAPLEGSLPADPVGCGLPGYACSTPVGLSNGEVKERVVDLQVPARGFPFVWGRSYSSRMNESGPMGFNWEISYHRRIATVSGSTLALMNGAGREDLYTSVGGNQFAPPAGVYDALVKNPDNTFTQTDPDGVRFDYDTAGYLAAITDRTGNALIIQRNGFHNITQVTDTQGRLYTIAYTDGTAAQKVASLTDFAGRQIAYTYDGNGDLIRVRGPLVTGTPNGNDFPSGKTTLYTYTSGFANQKQNHNLVSIVDPAYNVADNPALSKAKVTFTYAPTTNALDEEFDQVIGERWGHDQGGPPANPGVVVGGTKTFSYARNPAGDASAPAGAALRTTVTDANGNVQVHYFNSARLEVRSIARTNRDVRPGEGDYVTDLSYTPEGLPETRTMPRGNQASFQYDTTNPARRSQKNLLEERRRAAGIGGGGVDLVTRYTYEPAFNRMRTATDPRAFPNGSVPLALDGQINLADPQVARYTTTRFFDYQEGTGMQAALGIPVSRRIPEGLGDLNAAADFNQGNIVKIAHPAIQTAGPNLGQTAAETFTWNDRGQPLTSVDPEGHVTRSVYYPTNGILNDAGDREGYLQSLTQDFGGFNLTMQFEYDTSGNVSRAVDPKGQDVLNTFNALNQVVRSRSRVAFGTTRYQTDLFYDANDNLTRVERQNLDENGAPYPHALLMTTSEFDILRDLVARTVDKSANDNGLVGTVRVELSYDANLNLQATRFPLSVSGAVPSNILSTLYDERNLPYKVTLGDNDINPANAPPPSASVTTANYDPNGEVLETIDSLRQAQHAFAPVTAFPGSAAGDVTRRQYDGFDRIVRIIDGEGNEGTLSYDAASNVVLTMRLGPVDHTAGAFFGLLAQVNRTYDERSRLVQEDARHFAAATGAPLGDGHRVTQQKYDRDGKTVEVTDDRGLRITTQWDTAERRFKAIDALTNETEYGYDLNGNVTSVTRRDLSTDLGTPVQSFLTGFAYDGLDRLIRTVDPAGNVHEGFYDSRGNLVQTSDGVRGSGHPSGPGNIVRLQYDGLDRLVRTERVLTASGRGDTAPAGLITTLQAWDDDSRLVSATDNNGHATSYGYDPLNRRTSITSGDGTSLSMGYDTDNHLTQWTDPNGSAVTATYDGVNRLRTRTVVRGAGVLGTTFENFGYDGVGRVTFAQDDDGINPGTLDCFFEYDSLSNRTRDLQGTLSTDSVHDAVGNRTQITYPGQFGGGRRVLTLTYDNLNRLRSLADPAVVATLHYKGMRRLERRTYGIDAAPVSRLDIGYDAMPRAVDVNHTTGGGAAIAEFQYGFDREDHRLYEKRVHEGNTGDAYKYDSVYRLARASRDVDLSTVPPGTELDPDTYAAAPNRLEFALDGVGNRMTTASVAAGVPTITTWTQTAGGLLKDAEVNQYTSTQEGALPARSYTYDANGNMTSDGTKTFAYDFKNRLVEARDQATSALIARYSYDALDRRAAKFLPAGTTRYIYDGARLLEERDGANALVRQYVWGIGIDNLLQEKTAGATFYSHENAIGSIAALTSVTGTVVERYRYDPYGLTTVSLDGATGNRIRFQGAYFDDETGLYHLRRRAYSPTLGRFLQRDPLGAWQDAAALGNQLTFAANDPIDNRDPWGLLSVKAGDDFPSELLDRLRAELLAALGNGSLTPEQREALGKLRDILTTIEGNKLSTAFVKAIVDGMIKAFDPEDLAGKLLKEGLKAVLSELIDGTGLEEALNGGLGLFLDGILEDFLKANPTCGDLLKQALKDKAKDKVKEALEKLGQDLIQRILDGLKAKGINTIRCPIPPGWQFWKGSGYPDFTGYWWVDECGVTHFVFTFQVGGKNVRIQGTGAKDPGGKGFGIPHIDDPVMY